MAAAVPSYEDRDVRIVDIDRPHSQFLSDEEASDDSLAEPIVAQPQELKNVSPLKALAMYVALNLTKWAYVTDAILKNYKRRYKILNFPTYSELLREKENCYPPKKDLFITKNSARIKLQSIMDLTTKRLLMSLKHPVVKTTTNRQFTLISKWGFDRAASQSLCHKTRDGMAFNFMICVVPLQLVSNGVTLWKNDRPCSTSYCRPVLFKYMKYTKQNVRQETLSVQNEIDTLLPTVSHGIRVTHRLTSKVMDVEYHSVTPQSVGSVCTACKSTAMKNNPHIGPIKEKPVINNSTTNTYGMSTLHAWTRSMECIIELSHRVEVMSWHPKSAEGQRKMNRKKRKTISEFKLTRLLLDISDQTHECLYKGNTARHFFRRCNSYALMINVNGELLQRICVVLLCLTSGRRIILSKFRQYCRETINLYTGLYPWYYMPYPLHKLLVHGPDHVENYTVIPIGVLCEGATEATDREYFKHKKSLMTKFASRPWNIKILFHLLLISDPLLTSIQAKVKSSWFKELYQLTYREKASSVNRVVNVPDIEGTDESEFGDDFDDDENEKDF